MTAVISPIEDSLFEELAGVLDKCALHRKGGCLSCPHLNICRLWWDNRVCAHCEQSNLDPTFFELYSREFVTIQKGKNGYHKKYPAMAIARIG